MKDIYTSDNNLSLKINGKDEYENFLSDINLDNNIHIDTLKLYNLYNYIIIDLSKFIIRKLQLHIGDKPKYILPSKIEKLVLIKCDKDRP